MHGWKRRVLLVLLHRALMELRWRRKLAGPASLLSLIMMSMDCKILAWNIRGQQALREEKCLRVSSEGSAFYSCLT